MLKYFDHFSDFMYDLILILSNEPIAILSMNLLIPTVCSQIVKRMPEEVHLRWDIAWVDIYTIYFDFIIWLHFEVTVLYSACPR